MCAPIRMRGKLANGNAEIRVLMTHLAFRFGGAKAGDTLAVTWKDNTGDSRTDTLTLA